MNKLKPCPFCGQLPETEVFVTQKSSCIDEVILFSVVCGKCGASKSVKLKIKTKSATFLEVEQVMEAATNAWNTRYKPIQADMALLLGIEPKEG